MNQVPGAIRVLTEALRREPDYRYSWQASIAMSLYDAFRNAGYDFPELHRLCNVGADNFLQLLTKDFSMDKDEDPAPQSATGHKVEGT